jgi:hypothetical protein
MLWWPIGIPGSGPAPAGSGGRGPVSPPRALRGLDNPQGDYVVGVAPHSSLRPGLPGAQPSKDVATHIRPTPPGDTAEFSGGRPADPGISNRSRAHQPNWTLASIGRTAGKRAPTRRQRSRQRVRSGHTWRRAQPRGPSTALPVPQRAAARAPRRPTVAQRPATRSRLRWRAVVRNSGLHELRVGAGIVASPGRDLPRLLGSVPSVTMRGTPLFSSRAARKVEEASAQDSNALQNSAPKLMNLVGPMTCHPRLTTIGHRTPSSRLRNSPTCETQVR